MKALYITDWDQFYETNSDNGRWKLGQTKRLRALEYVRWYVLGPDGNNISYLEVAAAVKDKYGDEAWILAWGLFAKLAELAGRHKRELRGFILGKGGSPISPRMLQVITGFTPEQITQGTTMLCDECCGWLQWRELPLPEASPSSATSPPLQEAKAKAEAETKAQAQAETEGQGQGASGAAPSPVSVSESVRYQTPERFAHDFGLVFAETSSPWDVKTFTKLARDHLILGHLGERGFEDCFNQARAFVADPGIHSAKGRFVKWVTVKLQEAGHPWKDFVDPRVCGHAGATA